METGVIESEDNDKEPQKEDCRQGSYDENATLREINQFGNTHSIIGHLQTPLSNPLGGISMALWDIICKYCNRSIVLNHDMALSSEKFAPKNIFYT